MLRAHLFNWLGNFSFRLNGGLDGLERQNLRNKIMTWAWSIAYGLFDADIDKEIRKKGGNKSDSRNNQTSG